MAHKKAFIQRYLEESVEAPPAKQRKGENVSYNLRNRAGVIQEQTDVIAAPTPTPAPAPTTFEVVRRKGRKEATMDRIQPIGNTADYGIFLADVQPVIQPIVTEEARKQNGIKFHLIADITFRNHKEPYDTQNWNSVSKAVRVLPNEEYQGDLIALCSEMVRRIEEYIERGSGWIVDSVNFIDLYTNRYRPLRGQSFIPAPQSLSSKTKILI